MLPLSTWAQIYHDCAALKAFGADPPTRHDSNSVKQRNLVKNNEFFFSFCKSPTSTRQQLEKPIKIFGWVRRVRKVASCLSESLEASDAVSVGSWYAYWRANPKPVYSKSPATGPRSLHFASHRSRWPPLGVLMLETNFPPGTDWTCSHALSDRLNIITTGL